MTNEVFISYSRKDLERVRKIKSEIDQQVGIDCWMDLDGIESGDEFLRVIVGAIKRSDTILFMLSSNSVGSEWAMDELDFARKEGKRIVLVDLEHTKMSDNFWFRYHRYDTIDWQSQSQREKLFCNLKSWFSNPQPKTQPETKPQLQPVKTTNYTQPRQSQHYTATKPNWLSANKKLITWGIAGAAVIALLILLLARSPHSSSSNDYASSEAITSSIPSPIQQLLDNMVYVEGGTFLMGSSDSDANDDEQPVHQVTLSSYYIGKYEVTQEEWETVMGSNPSSFRGASLPVEQVSWENCQMFIQRLNQLTGLHFRLPTEAEWEFAARGGNVGKSHNYKYSGSNNIDAVGWYEGNSGNQTHPVGQKNANELGLYDMTGNVWECCQDWYGGYSSDAQTNPTGPASSSRRLGRGGSWYDNARRCRVSCRGYGTPSSRDDLVGLRLAR